MKIVDFISLGIDCTRVTRGTARPRVMSGGITGRTGYGGNSRADPGGGNCGGRTGERPLSAPSGHLSPARGEARPEAGGPGHGPGGPEDRPRGGAAGAGPGWRRSPREHGPGPASGDPAQRLTVQRPRLTRSSSSGPGKIEHGPGGHSKPREGGRGPCGRHDPRPQGTRSGGPRCCEPDNIIGRSEAAPAGRLFLRLGAACPGRAGAAEDTRRGDRPRAGGMIGAGENWYRDMAGTIGPGCILYQSVFDAA